MLSEFVILVDPVAFSSIEIYGLGLPTCASLLFKSELHSLPHVTVLLPAFLEPLLWA